MFNVRFVKEQVSIEAKGGENLLELMRRAGLNPDAPCGGNGKCGKCMVRLYFDGSSDQEQGEMVRACQYPVVSDLKVMTLEKKGGEQILTEGKSAGESFDPAVRLFEVTVEKCPAGKSISDWTRFLQALEREGVTDVRQINTRAASVIGSAAKANGGKLWAIVYQPADASAGNEVLAVRAEKPAVYMVAFDIGTTTVAGYLVNALTGEREAVTSRMNPQAQYGADVINRANYTLEHGMEEVASCIRSTINDMLCTMSAQVGIQPEDIYEISIAGNTCMHHLFLGVSVDSLVHAPYNPAIQEAMTLRCAEYGIQAAAEAKLVMLPNIAGFVGADTVACLVSTKLAEEDKWTLLIDIGTNGEMVLGKAHHMTACSTAAGPAFEGAGITCGMRGAPGAVSKAKYEDGKWTFETVGGAKPIGICGSGLLDLTAQLLESGQMDESGAIELDLPEGSEAEDDRLVIATQAESGNGREIHLEQKDVRQLQLAKSAIASGVGLLAERTGIDVSEIGQVWLAGAFGSFLSPESACRIGLIPPVLRGKIKAVGNAAGEGAVAVIRDRKELEYAKRAAHEADFLELAGMPQFQDRFVDNLMFPDENGVIDN